MELLVLLRVGIFLEAVEDLLEAPVQQHLLTARVVLVVEE
jgi:hypothetical protein